MTTSDTSTVIPKEVALQLCEEIRQENRGKWFTFNGLWCWGCARFSGDPQKRCFAATPDNRGCSQINQRYDKRLTFWGKVENP